MMPLWTGIDTDIYIFHFAAVQRVDTQGYFPLIFFSTIFFFPNHTLYLSLRRKIK